MMRSKKVLAVSFLAIGFLVGCGDSEPSDSDIIKQLSNQISPCPELSITNFQKINGYPQNDGSYVDQIQYNLVFTPSDEMLNYVTNYENKKKAIESEGAADSAAANEINARAQSMVDACKGSYQSDITGYNKALGIDSGDEDSFNNDNESSLSDNPTDGNELGANATLVDSLIGDTTEKLQQAQKNLIADEDNNTWIQQGGDLSDDLFSKNPPTFTAEDAKEQATAVALETKNISKLTDYLKLANEVKAQLVNTVNQYSTCQGNVQKLYQDNQGVFDHLKALNTEMVSAQSENLNSLQNKMNTDCPIIIIGGVLGLFNADKNNIEAYGQSYKLAESGTVHLIKSDNGWVTQN